MASNNYFKNVVFLLPNTGKFPAKLYLVFAKRKDFIFEARLLTNLWIHHISRKIACKDVIVIIGKEGHRSSDLSKDSDIVNSICEKLLLLNSMVITTYSLKSLFWLMLFSYNNVYCHVLMNLVRACSDGPILLASQQLLKVLKGWPGFIFQAPWIPLIKATFTKHYGWCIAHLIGLENKAAGPCLCSVCSCANRLQPSCSTGYLWWVWPHSNKRYSCWCDILQSTWILFQCNPL